MSDEKDLHKALCGACHHTKGEHFLNRLNGEHDCYVSINLVYDEHGFGIKRELEYELEYCGCPDFKEPS